MLILAPHEMSSVRYKAVRRSSPGVTVMSSETWITQVFFIGYLVCGIQLQHYHQQQMALMERRKYIQVQNQQSGSENEMIDWTELVNLVLQVTEGRFTELNFRDLSSSPLPVLSSLKCNF